MDAAVAARVLRHARQIGPRCGSSIVIAIDGRSGSGKSTLASQVSALAEAEGLTTTTLNLDTICPGWNGLSEVPARIRGLLEQLAERGRATYPTWDWHAGRAGPDRSISAPAVLVLEGVAAADPHSADLISATVWMDAPTALRKQRALARDGDDFAPFWDQWARAEDEYLRARPPLKPDFAIEAD